MAATDYELRERERLEVRDWLRALDEVLEREGPERTARLLAQLQRRAARAGVRVPYVLTTPYLNTIAADDEPPYPGDRELEERIEAIVRWNAMAMVVRGNRRLKGIGGHIGSYMSAATLFEVGFNHFFRGRDHPEGGDQVYFQGHASTGVYARAFLEGRLGETQLDNFRRELQPEGGLSSYPHPWLMPGFWELPTVSMGLAPIMAVYQARFDRYLQRRGLAEATGRVWAVLGDGEMDEPEALGALQLASREGLGNLHFVIDCNLQRLDGPVRGSGKVVQELEAVFRGAGWRVIKVLWGGGWDPLLERDAYGLLAARLEEVPDGELQRCVVEGGATLREVVFGGDPDLEELVGHMSDAELARLERGGHDVAKVHAAFRAAEEEAERPTVVLAQTVKGHGLGEAGEALNVAHKTKVLGGPDLRAFRDRLRLPIPDEGLEEAPYYQPAEDGPERRYAAERREDLGGPVPARSPSADPLDPPGDDAFAGALQGSEGREATTTVALVRLLGDLLRDERLGPLLVPIVPDEARTFGLEALFRRIGIYAPGGQRYRPVDADSLVPYDEREDGQLLEEGITEAGAMSSFIAAGTAYATHGVNTIPFFFFYSMFGFQRVGDLMWAAGDSRARGFLIGATSGRTTLNGEGLQHQDGHSQLTAWTHPRVRAWDPAYAYELAVIVQDGLRRMFSEGEDELCYITLANEPYAHPPLPEGDGVREGILRGLYRLRPSRKHGETKRARLLASGTFVNVALAAQRRLEEDYGVTADVWSVTSWKGLHEDGLAAEREALLRPDREARVPWVRRCLGDDPGAVVGVSDWVKALPSALSRFLPVEVLALGTDGFGRSDGRAELRDFFEVDERYVTLAALTGLARQGRLPWGTVERARDELGIDPDKPDPLTA